MHSCDWLNRHDLKQCGLTYEWLVSGCVGNNTAYFDLVFKVQHICDLPALDLLSLHLRPAVFRPLVRLRRQRHRSRDIQRHRPAGGAAASRESGSGHLGGTGPVQPAVCSRHQGRRWDNIIQDKVNLCSMVDNYGSLTGILCQCIPLTNRFRAYISYSGAQSQTEGICIHI